MGEIRIVSPGKTRGYPYPVCKKIFYVTWSILFDEISVSLSLGKICDIPYPT